MIQFNSLHDDEPNEPPRECSIQPPAAHFKYSTYNSKTSPVVSAFMGGLNHHVIDNGDVKVHTSYFQLNLTLNHFQIQTPLLLNQSMTIKWIISWNYSIHNVMKIFWMLTSRYLNI